MTDLLSVRRSRRDVLKFAALAGTSVAVAACAAPASSVVPSASGSAPSAAASAAPSSSSAGRKTVPIKLFMVSGSNTDFFTEAGRRFGDSRPFDIALEVTEDSNENIKTTYRTQLSSQNPPDISFLFAGQRFIKDVADAKLVIDLAPYADQFDWASRFNPGVYEDFIYADTLPQVAVGAAPHVFVWYNTKIFKDLSLTVPENRVPTAEEFANYVKVTGDAGFGPIAMGNKDRWPGGHVATIMFHRTMNVDQLKELRKGWYGPSDAKWTDPGPLKALALLQDYSQKGYFAPGANAMADGEAQSLFGSGKAAMYESGYWVIGILPTQFADLEFDYFHFPLADPAIPLSIINFANIGTVISSKSQVQDEAAAFIDYCLGPEGQRMYFEKFSGYPSTTLLAGMTDLTATQPQWPAMLDTVANVPNNPFQLENDAPGEVATQSMQDLQSVIDLSMTPEEWGTRTQSLLEEVRAG